MKRFVGTLLVVTLLAVPALRAAYEIKPEALRSHVAVLASDSLEGREVGEPGEWKASEYMISQFRQAGLEPLFTGDFRQVFEFTKKIEHGPANQLTLNDVALTLGPEFSPMPQSANAAFSFSEIIPVDYGIVSEDSSYNDYSGKDVAGKAVLIKRFAPADSVNPHVDFSKYSSFTDKINTAIARQAAGIFFITPSDQDDTVQSMGVTNIAAKAIPIVFLRRAALERLGLSIDSPALASAVGQTELIRVRDTGYNVAGILRGQTDTAIVIGAHYDHLGWGGPASRYVGTERKIHYGADDNASGTAGLLELAKYFADRRDHLRYSLVFTAFSGEEAGILGSSHFVRSGALPNGMVRMMLNMDMIGRLKDQESGLAVFGTGTATEFKNYFDSLKVDSFKVAFREPGTGPSDHTAFYNSDIPVLHFFTGAHQDYHSPDDTWDKIDYAGVTSVARLVADIVTHFEEYPHALTFQKTVDPDAGKRMSTFSVTLGIMPDYISQVKGLKVDGVSANRPGERAGLKKGDVIIKMGSHTIGDIGDYMAALSKFRKGDSTGVLVERGADTLNLPVVFK